jgi:hypothetical protein
MHKQKVGEPHPGFFVSPVCCYSLRRVVSGSSSIPDQRALTMSDKFSKKIVSAIDEAKILGIRAGPSLIASSASGRVVEGRVFVRS